MKRQKGEIELGGLHLSYAGLSDRGHRRTENEDDFLVMAEQGLFCLADGMGGLASGKLASRTTLSAVAEAMRYLESRGKTPIPAGLSAGMLAKPMLLCLASFANFQVRQLAAGRQLGSTLVAAHFTGTNLDYAHVGDSRLYLLREEELIQLTEDHSLVYEMYTMGTIGLEELDRHPLRNIITRSIGTSAEVEADLGTVDVQADDVFLLCSDGLTTMLGADEIRTTLAAAPPPLAAAAQLVDLANAAGGLDNITVLLIAVQGEPATSA